MALAQESWLYLRNALSSSSSSQKNSSSFWKKARKEIKSSRHQVAIPDRTGVSWFQSTMSGGVWRREAGRACYPRSKWNKEWWSMLGQKSSCEWSTPVTPEQDWQQTGDCCKSRQQLTGCLDALPACKLCKMLLSAAWVISASWSWLLYLHENVSSLLLAAASWALAVWCSIWSVEISPGSCCHLLCQESCALFSCYNTKLPQAMMPCFTPH